MKQDEPKPVSPTTRGAADGARNDTAGGARAAVADNRTTVANQPTDRQAELEADYSKPIDPKLWAELESMTEGLEAFYVDKDQLQADSIKSQQQRAEEWAAYEQSSRAFELEEEQRLIDGKLEREREYQENLRLMREADRIFEEQDRQKKQALEDEERKQRLQREWTLRETSHNVRVLFGEKGKKVSQALLVYEKANKIRETIKCTLSSLCTPNPTPALLAA